MNSNVTPLFQDSETGCLLEERTDACETVADELESAGSDMDADSLPKIEDWNEDEFTVTEDEWERHVIEKAEELYNVVMDEICSIQYEGE